LCDTALLTIVVNAVNDAPIAVSDTILMPQNVAYSGNLVSNDVDVDSPVLLANTTSLNGPLHGSLFLANSGVYTYTPNPGYSGADFFQYIVCDTETPSKCDTGDVFIQVGLNQAPVAIADFFSINEDAPLTNASVISNDFDPDGSALIVSASPVISPLHGTLILNANGQFVYTPNLNFNGTDSFAYRICDGGTPNLCDTALATIQINPVNDAPQAFADSYQLNSNSTLTDNVTLNDTDVEGLQLTVNPSPVFSPQNGSIALGASGQFSYTPSTNFIGIDSFAYSICDGGFPVLCDTAIVFIQVKNRIPIAVADSFAMASGGILNANCVLNDSDPEGSTLKINTQPVINVSHGTLSLNSSGTFFYQPQQGFTGIDFFFYTVCDSAAIPLCANAKVIILVRNTAPFATNDTIYGNADANINGNVLLNDTDSESVNLTAFVVNSVQHGTLLFQSNGDFEYLPGAGYSGVDEFSYRVCDDGVPSLCDTAFVFIRIGETNSELIIPNAFSPNGDNVNDLFEINGIHKFPNNVMQIFDRNGLLVYNVTGYRNFWNGRDKRGNVLENGSYFYVLDKKDGSEAIVGYVVISK
jgi:gliding motility-associated-like protein